MIADIHASRQQQLEYAAQVVRYDAFIIAKPTLIAGADVGFEQ